MQNIHTIRIKMHLLPLIEHSLLAHPLKASEKPFHYGFKDKTFFLFHVIFARCYQKHGYVLLIVAEQVHQKYSPVLYKSQHLLHSGILSSILFVLSTFQQVEDLTACTPSPFYLGSTALRSNTLISHVNLTIPSRQVRFCQCLLPPFSRI